MPTTSPTQAQVGADRSILRKINTIADTYGKTATFTYCTDKVAGQWAVEQIDLPNDESVTFAYDDLLAWNDPNWDASQYDKAGLTGVTMPPAIPLPTHAH